MKALIALALALIACAPQSSAQPPADAQGVSGTLLVGNKGENTLSFIDLATGAELGRAATGTMPHEIAISPDGRHAAVVAYGGRSIDIFDVRTRAKLRTIDLSPNQGPHGIAWLADGRILATTERSQSLAIVDTGRNDAVSAIATGQQGTHMVAVSPDRRHAFTANIQAGTVSVLDLEAGRPIRTFTVSGEPEGIALTPDGRTLWVGDLEGARVQAFDVAMLTAPDESRYTPVVRIDVAIRDARQSEVESAALRPLLRRLAGPGLARTLHGAAAGRGWVVAIFEPGTTLAQVRERAEQAVRAAGPDFPAGRTEVSFRHASSAPVATVATGPIPIRVAASPDGRWIVTSNMGNGSLTIINARTRAAVREIAVGGQAAGQVTIIFSADGRRLYAAETGRNQIAEVDLATGRVLRRLAAGAQGDGLAIVP